MASNLDGAGQIKMEALDAAQIYLQRLHSIVERLGVAVRSEQNTGSFRMQLQRVAAPLASLMKAQFGTISDLATGMILISSRAGSDQMKLRALREAVAQVRMQLEIAATKVKEKHAVDHSSGGDAEG